MESRTWGYARVSTKEQNLDRQLIALMESGVEERNIILVHQFVTAGTVEPERTESEVLSLGGIENVDVSNFECFDYVAIGHVHRPQKNRKRYC